MKISVKFFVFDLPPDFKDAELELAPGALVSDALNACLDLFKKRNVTMDVNELFTSIVMIGGKWSDPNTPVSDGDTLTIIRPLDGG